MKRDPRVVIYAVLSAPNETRRRREQMGRECRLGAHRTREVR